MTIIFITVGVLWLVCGLLDASYVYNHFQLAYPETRKENESIDFHSALLFIWLGPIALCTDWAQGFCGKGLAFRRHKREN